MGLAQDSPRIHPPDPNRSRVLKPSHDTGGPQRYASRRSETRWMVIMSAVSLENTRWLPARRRWQPSNSPESGLTPPTHSRRTAEWSAESTWQWVAGLHGSEGQLRLKLDLLHRSNYSWAEPALPQICSMVNPRSVTTCSKGTPLPPWRKYSSEARRDCLSSSPSSVITSSRVCTTLSLAGGN